MTNKKYLIAIISALVLIGALFIWLFSEQFLPLLGLAVSPLFSTLLALTAAFVLLTLKRRLGKYLEKKNRNYGALVFGLNFAFGAALFVLAIPVLSEFGVPTASLITVLGTSSLAIGLALRNFLANIAAGIMLVFQKPFDIGDIIECSGTLGYVDKIDLFSVRVKTFSNELVYIPNGKLASDKVTNKNRKSKRRIEAKIDISYKADLKLAKQILLDLMQNDERILLDPAPTVAVDELADSGIVLLVRFWAMSADMMNAKYDLLENTLLQFEAQNIEIPYPQIDVWMRSHEQ